MFERAHSTAKDNLRRLHRAWFRYAFPSIFLAAGLARRSSATGDSFLLVASLLTLPTCFRGCSEPSSWRRTQLLLLTVTFLLFAAALAAQITCRLGVLPDFWQQLLASLRLGGLAVGSCGRTWDVWCEAACFGSSFTSWVLGRVGIAPAGSAGPVRQMLLALMLMTCAVLDFNAFAALYHGALVLLVLRLAFGTALLRVAGSEWFQTSLCVLALMHVVAVLTLSSVAAPQWLLQLLGASPTRLGAAQTVTAFLLAELLIWRPAPRALPQQPLTAEEGGLSASSVELEMSGPSGSMSRPTFRRARSAPTSMGSSRRGRQRPLLATWLRDLLIDFARGPVLPVTALLTWSFQWPSLLAVPLLAGALILMVVPVEKQSQRFLRVALIYLSLYAVVLYVYNVYLSCHGTSPATSVPEKFTWPERWGLQSFLPESAGRQWVALFRLRFVLVQSFCLLLLATSIRCADFQPLALVEEPRNWLTALSRWSAWLGRLGAVVASVALAFAGGLEGKELSLMGLGFLLWSMLLSLSAYCAPAELCGWDGLRGHACVWWALFLYAAPCSLTLLIWQVLGADERQLPGLLRSVQPGPLICAALAALQVRAFRAEIPSPAWMLDSQSLLAQFLSTLGIFVPLALMFVAVMLPPVSMFSFAVLLLFVAMAAVEQFGLQRFRSTVLTLSCLVAAVQLPVRFCSMLPAFHRWIQEHLPEETHKVLWESLALKVADQQDACRKLMLMVALMLTSSYLCRGYKFWQQEEPLPGASRLVGSAAFTALRLLASWSEPAMIFVSYFLLLSTDLLTRLQLAALTALLASCRGWSYAGGLVSVSAMASLLIQYLLRFEFIGVLVSNKDTAAWLGLLWKKSLIGSEVSLAALGIAQHAIHRVAAHVPETTRKSQQELVAHSAMLGATLLLCTMIFSADAWSIVSVSMVAAFLASGDAGQMLTAQRANGWLRTMSIVLVLSLSISWALQTWLPPGYPAPPLPEDVAKWPLCALFDGHTPVSAHGKPCNPFDAGCQTQQQRCGKAWIAWLRLRGGGRGHGAIEFLALFVICLLRRACLAEKDLSYESSSGEPESFTQISQPGTALMQAQDGESYEETVEQPGAASAFEQLPSVWFHHLCATAVWISLAGAAVFQTSANIISVVYMLLLFCCIYTAGVTKPVPLRKRMKVLRAVRGFNMLIMVIWAIYQCPSLPCPLLLQLADEGSTAFLGPTQCVWLEAHPSQSSYGAGVMRGVSIALQSVGLRKVANTIFFDWLNVLNIAMFFSASLLAMICSRWERQLAAQLEEDALELQQRSGFYVQHVARWRSLELQQVATKHWVLREKLRDLIEHLNNLRAFWANQGRGKPLTKEESRRRARVLDLCLRTGAPPSEIEPVLGQFVEAAGVEDETGMDDVTYEVLQNCVIQLMRARELQVLQRIADAEVRAREDELMEKCRALKPAEEESEPQETEAVAGSTKDAQAEAELPAEPEAAAQSGERSEAPPSRPVEHAQELVQRTRPLLEAIIDDLLFCRLGDATLQEHRNKNSFLVLLGKALWSQSFALLAIAATLQFASSRSVLAFGTVFTVVISQMFFPHAPPSLWRFLQIYNIVTITLKMLYQLPIFCVDGSIDFRGCQEVTLVSAPWSAVLGLLKVDSQEDGPAMTVRSLSQALSMDVLFGAVLFFHCHVLCQGGRLQCSPREVCRTLEEEAPDAGGQDARSEAEIRRSQSDLRRPTSAGEVSSTSVVSQEEWTMAAWLKESCLAAHQEVMTGAELTKPAKDLYTWRFVLSLACFLLLLLFWNALAGTGRSFTATLMASIFSGTQVFAIIAVLACMIADRALYTWYTQERFLAEGSGVEAESTSSSPGHEPSAQGAEASRSPSSSRLSLPSRGDSSPVEVARRSTVAAVMQMSLLLLQLVALHAVLIAAWAQSASPSAAQASMFGNFMLLFFYALYVSYLVLSALQLRYDVHMVQGGLGLTHSVQFGPWLLFKVYTTVPFIEELRVLTDWTVTGTSLNLFMWFKLEDAQQNLYKTRCDMNGRKYVKPYAKRPLREKILQGGLFLLALFVLIVGPVTYFSTANLFLKSNLVYTGSLKASLEVELEGGGISQLPLYDTAQADISLARSDETLKFAASYPSMGNAVDLNLQTLGWDERQQARAVVRFLLNYQPGVPNLRKHPRWS
ncbi:unnamed protein product [Effrenium voratum]|nr:unnamed protein product [Effrenium voratum]